MRLHSAGCGNRGWAEDRRRIQPQDTTPGKIHEGGESVEKFQGARTAKAGLACLIPSRRRAAGKALTGRLQTFWERQGNRQPRGLSGLLSSARHDRGWAVGRVRSGLCWDLVVLKESFLALMYLQLFMPG